MKFYIVLLLCMLSLQVIQAQNESLCLPADIEVREGNTTVTCEPGAMTWIRFKTSRVNTPYAFAVTDQDGTILRYSISDKVSFLGLPGGKLRVYAISYIGLVLAEDGDNLFTDELASVCSAISPNYIEVLNIVPEGGIVSSSNDRDTEYICTDDNLPDILTFISNVNEPKYAYIITDNADVVLDVSIDGTADFSNAPAGICRVYGISYTGELLVENGLELFGQNLAEGCYDVSDNYVSVIRTEPEGATITANGSAEDIIACDYPGGTGFTIELANNNEQTFYYGYLISNEAETTYRVIEGNSIALEDLPTGNSRLWGISYAGQLAPVSGNFSDVITDAVGCFDLSDNYITVSRQYVEGGEITFTNGGTETRPCGLDGIPDIFGFNTTSTSPENYAWILSDDKNNILGVYTENSVNIDPIEAIHDFRVRGLSYSGDLLPVEGEKVNKAIFSDACFQISENFVTITRLLPDGGTVSLTDGGEEFAGCDSPDIFGEISIELANTGKTDFAYVYLITDTDYNILDVNESGTIILSDLPEGASLVWGVSYEGTLLAEPGDNTQTSILVNGCYDLSDNAVTLERTVVEGGVVSLSADSEGLVVCGTDDIPDVFKFQTSSSAQATYAWILTDNNDNILKIQSESEISIDDITNNNRFKVWGLSYSGDLLPVIGKKITSDLSDGCFQLSDNSVSLRRLLPDAGNISLSDGTTEYFGCDSPDTEGQIVLDLQNTGKVKFDYAYLVTDKNNKIIRIINGTSITLSELPSGNSRIWGINYDGTLAAQVGDNVLSSSGLADCFDLSDNSISVERTVVDGGDIAILDGSTEALTCGNDDIPDAFTFNSTTIAKDKNYILVVTDENNKIFSTANGGIIDFDLFAAGIYRVWGLSYTGVPNVPFGKNLTNIALSDGCYDLSNNFVTIRQEETNGGTLQFTGGGTQYFTCPGDGNADFLKFVNNGFTSQSYIYLITDLNNVILDTSTDPTYDFENFGEGTCRVWGLAYSGTLNAPVGSQVNGLELSDECFSLSTNFLTVVKETPTAGVVSLANSNEDTIYTCPNDGTPDIISFETTSTYPGVYLYLITHEDDRVVDVSFTGSYNFDFAEPGICHVYGVAFTGNWVIQEGDLITETILSDDCYSITENFITIIREQPTAGEISFTDGSEIKYTCPGDGKADSLSFNSTSTFPGKYIYLITDENGTIVTSTEDSVYDFENVDLGVCQVYGAAYTGNLIFQEGDNIGLVNISDDCFDVSDNALTIVRDTPNGGSISTLGLSALALCVGDAYPDILPFEVTGASNANYAYLVTDENGILDTIFAGPEFDFNNMRGGIARVYGLSYAGDLLAVPGDDIFAVSITSDCYDLSENFVTLDLFLVDGSIISTGSGSTDIEYICSGDGNPDVITFQTQNDDSRVKYQFLITNTSNSIIGDINDNMLDLEGSPFDSIRIWGVAYTGAAVLATGMDVTTAVLSDSCYDVSDNFITLVNDLPEGGTVTTASGKESVIVCIGGTDGLLAVINNSPSQAGYAYLITTTDGIIVGDAVDGELLDFNSYDPGNYLVYGLSYTGQLTYQIGDDIAATTLATSCYEISVNTIAVERTPPLDGGSITSAFGNPLYVCLNDGIPDIGAFETTSLDANYRYVITDTLNNILIPDIVGNVIDFDKAQPNFCRVYGVSYTGTFIATAGLNVFEDPLSDLCSAISENYIDLIKANIIGGTVATVAGDTEITVTVGDGNPDVVEFANSDASGVSYAFIITNEENEILSILNGQATNFEPAESGICRVWGLAYSGEIIVGAGAVIDQVVLTTGCADLSDNFITVNKTDGGSPLVDPHGNTAEADQPNLQLHVYPNPVSHTINLQLSKLKDLENGEEVLIQVFDISGKPRLTERINLYDHQTTYPLDVSELSFGVYVVRITDGSSRVQERFFKQ
ncbi:MAG: T9SS type A sorting domain-containing protein [Saprospiraceae bacterium]